MSTIIIFTGLILSIIGLIKFKDKLILAFWILTFLFFLLSKFDFIKHEIFIYLGIVVLNSILITKHVLDQYSGKYKLLILVFVLLMLSIIRDAFHYQFFYEFLFIQILISIPIIIYVVMKSINEKNYFILLMAVLFVLNEIVRNSSLLGV